MGQRNIMRWLTGILCVGVLTGCGFFAQDEDEESSVAQLEEVYDIGSPVPAIGFGQSQAITL
ncbi:MAG: hypothetical protein ABFD81_17985, partial [Syntrophaceae bacterium]